MSIVTYSQPFIILFSASLTRTGGDTATIPYCLQAKSPAPNEAIVLQVYDAGNANQVWVYGSDQRIYLASTIDATPLCIDAKGGLTANGTPIVINPTNANKTQQWYPSSSTSPSTYINLVSNPKIVVDNAAGQIAAGNAVQTYESVSGNSNQVWTVWTPVLPIAGGDN